MGMGLVVVSDKETENLLAVIACLLYWFFCVMFVVDVLMLYERGGGMFGGR